MARTRQSLRFLLAAVGVAAASAAALAAGYADESKDWGISETSRPKGPPYGVPTPLKVPGAKTITTDELKEMLAKDPGLIIIDALGGAAMIESAQGLGSGIGEQRMFGKDVAMFPKALESLSGGDKAKPVVFYCLSSSCWHSYNASLRAVEAGYTNVLWYRGGIDAWKQSGGKTVPYALSGAFR
jgi:rhodanese-related sulfurtransferase